MMSKMVVLEKLKAAVDNRRTHACFECGSRHFEQGAECNYLVVVQLGMGNE